MLIGGENRLGRVSLAAAAAAGLNGDVESDGGCRNSAKDYEGAQVDAAGQRGLAAIAAAAAAAAAIAAAAAAAAAIARGGCQSLVL